MVTSAELSMKGFGGKARRMEAARKTEEQMGGCDQTVSYVSETG
jgi:hypothetical protein